MKGQGALASGKIPDPEAHGQSPHYTSAPGGSKSKLDAIERAIDSRRNEGRGRSPPDRKSRAARSGPAHRHREGPGGFSQAPRAPMIPRGIDLRVPPPVGSSSPRIKTRNPDAFDRHLRRDPRPQGARGRDDPRPLLSGRRDPGTCRRHRRQPQVGQGRDPGQDRDDRLLRRPLHGRDSQDAQPRQAGPAARPPRRLQPRRQLPGAEPWPSIQDKLHGRRSPFPDRDLHQQHGRRQGPVRLDRHLGERRGDHRAGCPRIRRDPLRARQAPRVLLARRDGSTDDPLGRLVHGPRGVQRPRPDPPQEADARGPDPRPSRVPRPTSASRATSSAAPRPC